MPEPSRTFAAPVAGANTLTGVTILLIEDSRYCSEAVRLMALRAGARLRRADSLASARRHLRMYLPDVVVVDLGLPDGSGLDLVRALQGRATRHPVVIATSGDTGDDARTAALAGGADAFLSKPVRDLDGFRQMIVDLLDLDTAPALAGADTEEPVIDDRALTDDLSRIRDILETALPARDDTQLLYCAQFVSSLAQTAHDDALARLAGAFFQRMDQGKPGRTSGQAMLHAVRARLDRAQNRRQIGVG